MTSEKSKVISLLAEKLIKLIFRTFLIQNKLKKTSKQLIIKYKIWLKI